jgi:YVTN family beta-propeller protein
MFNRSVILVSALMCAVAGTAYSAPAKDAPLYTLTKSIPIGAPDRWDLLDYGQTSHRVYIAHGDRVTVVNGQSGSVIGDVLGFAGGSHGVATVPQLNVGFSDDGEVGTASSFDLNTLKITKTFKADNDADAIAFDPLSGHVFVINGDAGNVTVIDPKTESVVARIAGGGKLEIGMADGAGNLYVNGEANKEIVRINTKTNKVEAHWAIPTCTSPHGMAIDTQSRRVFTTCENNVALAVDADTGKVVASLPIGSRTDGAAFDPVRKRFFSSNGDGTLTVIQERTPDSYVVLANIKTEFGARTMTIDPATGRLYLVTAEIKVNESAAPTDFRNRFKITPGSTRLLFWDPAS